MLAESIQKDGKSIDEIAAAITAAFAEFGVTPEHISAKLNKAIDKLDKADIVKLRKLYSAIKDGFVKPQDAFDMGAPAATEVIGADEADALHELNRKLSGGKAAAPAADEEEGKLPWE